MFLAFGVFFAVWAVANYQMGTAVRMGPLVFILGANVAYGYAMKPLGLVLATAVLVFLSAFGGHEFKWKEVTLLYVFLIVFSVLVFVKGLTLPFPLWPEALGY
jgi:hypothetical protein